LSIASRRGSFLIALAILAAAWTEAAAAKPSAAPVVKPLQEVTSLLSSHKVRSKPSAGSPQLGLVQARRPITEEQTVLPVLGHRTAADGRRWLRVRLPGRPNGWTGWIVQRATVSTWTSWHVIVNTSLRRVTVYKHGRQFRTFKAVVGKASTPTPHGEFFVEESIRLSASSVGAPFALALSARSNVLQEFDGGPGQIAFHGLANVGGIPGTAVSHGCVRLDAASMTWLVGRIGPGVPVTITG
jgi:lipoprotein-anchoring transpeptidase ErfK/SrfK